MIDNIEILEEETVEAARTSFVDMAHRVVLASIGAIAISQEEIGAFVNRLVERGEIAEKDGRKMISDVVERRREAASNVTSKFTSRASNEIDSRVETVLDRLNVPTKSDIDKLSRKINSLGRKIDQMKKAQEG